MRLGPVKTIWLLRRERLHKLFKNFSISLKNPLASLCSAYQLAETLLALNSSMPSAWDEELLPSDLVCLHGSPAEKEVKDAQGTQKQKVYPSAHVYSRTLVAHKDGMCKPADSLARLVSGEFSKMVGGFWADGKKVYSLAEIFSPGRDNGAGFSEIPSRPNKTVLVSMDQIKDSYVVLRIHRDKVFAAEVFA